MTDSNPLAGKAVPNSTVGNANLFVARIREAP